ncbi:MAG: hypothetical protein RMK92_08810, partial [Armatimonadota bacterium]|nr:hypothetical protein [Armatimonadota bacterium]
AIVIIVVLAVIVFVGWRYFFAEPEPPVIDPSQMPVGGPGVPPSGMAPGGAGAPGAAPGAPPAAPAAPR